jgi:uncharacterized RDD family membrane protein YckC
MPSSSSTGKDGHDSTTAAAYGYPPPPPDAPGYPPVPPQGYGLSKEAYTPWITRVGAFIIDIIPAATILGIGWVLGEIGLNCSVIRNGTTGFGYCGWAVSATGQFSATAKPLLTVALLLALASYVLAPAYWIWNLGYRQGKTGSSIGKSVFKFKVVSETSWQPIGFGPSVVRQIAHVVDLSVCYIGHLWPLWDPKRQTLADMIMRTVCVPLNPQPLPPGPPPQQC